MNLIKNRTNPYRYFKFDFKSLDEDYLNDFIVQCCKYGVNY